MLHPVDIVALVIMAFTWIRGMRRGFWRSLLDVVRVAAAYWAAYRYARPLGERIATVVAVPGIVGTIVGGVVAFLAVQSAFGLLEWILSQPSRRGHRGHRRISPPARFFGGIIGLATGAITVVVLCWAYGAARTTTWGARLPSGETSRAVKLSRVILSHGAYEVLRRRVDSPQQARRIAAMVSDPERTTVRLHEVIQSPRVAELVNDSTFGAALRSGDDRTIMQNPKLEALLADEATMTQLERLGIVPQDWRSPAFRSALGGQLAQVGARMDEVLEDSVTQRTIADLQREGLWQPERIPQLVMDARFLTLVERVMASTRARRDTLEATP